jgi:hypothetical protein
LDATKSGTLRVDPVETREVDTRDEDCWACIREVVPAIRKPNAAARHAKPK